MLAAVILAGLVAALRPAIGRDGSVVAFGSLAPNLVPNDVNELADVFVHVPRWPR